MRLFLYLQYPPISTYPDSLSGTPSLPLPLPPQGSFHFLPLSLAWSFYQSLKVCRLNSCCDTQYKHEGPEGVKWDLGFAYFCTRKMRFGSLGLGITKTKLGMGKMSENFTACVANVQ